MRRNLRYCYKTMWKKTKTLSIYSKTFKTQRDAKCWYKNFGMNIENIFDRELILTKFKV